MGAFQGDAQLALPAGKRARRKHVTRRELIRSARELFSVKGLYESRVEEITGQAGIAKGTLYKYYESKESLIREVVSEGFDELGRHIHHKTTDVAGIPNTVARLVEAHYEFFALNPDLMRILHQVRGLLKFHGNEWKPLRRVLAGHIDRLARLLGSATPGVRTNARAARELAILIFGAISGSMSVRVSIDPKCAFGTPPRALVRAMVAMSNAYLSPPAGAARRRS